MEDAKNEDLGILLAMVHVAWADKKLTEDELAVIRKEIDDHGLDEEEVRVVSRALLERPDVALISSYLTSAEARKAALVAAYATAYADESLDAAEIESIRELAVALGVSEPECKEIQAFAESRVRLARDGQWDKALLLENFVDE